jgi:hypothetical protein
LVVQRPSLPSWAGFNAALTTLRKSEFQFRHNPCNESFATVARLSRNSRCRLVNFDLLTYRSTSRRRGFAAPFVDVHVNNSRSAHRRSDVGNPHRANGVDSQALIRRAMRERRRAFCRKRIPLRDGGSGCTLAHL